LIGAYTSRIGLKEHFNEFFWEDLKGSLHEMPLESFQGVLGNIGTNSSLKNQLVK
jgi:hypothetical protein